MQFYLICHKNVLGIVFVGNKFALDLNISTLIVWLNATFCFDFSDNTRTRAFIRRTVGTLGVVVPPLRWAATRRLDNLHLEESQVPEFLIRFSVFVSWIFLLLAPVSALCLKYSLMFCLKICLLLRF